ncbi:thioredoxin family protein [Lewinella sp. W8]|uniref:thioredoxin family protein n=1 Tax=Lewinella sp. W8 TaxID=2528208 RepID=UPI0015667795|nr:thioredoxin family protein [Lewinella sp. W8]
MAPRDPTEPDVEGIISDWLKQSEEQLVVLLAEASWSGSSQIMVETLHTISNNISNLYVKSFDVETYPGLQTYFNVHQIPTIILLYRREVLNTIGGTISRKKLAAEIQKYAGS